MNFQSSAVNLSEEGAHSRLQYIW